MSNEPNELISRTAERSLAEEVIAYLLIKIGPYEPQVTFALHSDLPRSDADSFYLHKQRTARRIIELVQQEFDVWNTPNRK